MLLPLEVKEQVEIVLTARRAEDRAYRDVMDITETTPIEDVISLNATFEKARAIVSREEAHLATLTIRAVKSEVITS